MQRILVLYEVGKKDKERKSLISTIKKVAKDVISFAPTRHG